MPLTSKGSEILANMRKEYGEKAEQVFYASKNAGKISGVDTAEIDAKLDSLCAATDTFCNRVDMTTCAMDDHRVLGGVGFTPPSGGVRP